MAHTNLHRSFKERLGLLLAELRNSPGTFMGKIADDGGHLRTRQKDALHKEELLRDGYHEVTGPIVANLVEADAEAFAEATATDLEQVIAEPEFVPVEFHDVTLADENLIKWWSWTEQTDAGQWLRMWSMGPSPAAPWPENVTQEEVATWMLPTLKKYGHPMVADDGPEDLTPDEWARYNTDIQEERIGAWAEHARRSFIKAARGFTFPHNGTVQPPILLSLIVRHPKTGKPWTWWASSMAWLYLANPATVAERCVRAMTALTGNREALSAAARSALDSVEGEGKHTERMVGDLTEELRGCMPRACALLDVDTALQALRDRSNHGMLPWDEKAAAFLAALGSNGQRTAESLKEKAGTRFKDKASAAHRLFSLWEPQGTHRVPRFVQTLAQMLWQDVVGPRMERERQKPPALVRTVHGSVVGLLRTGHELKDRHLLDKDGNQLLLMERLSNALDVPTVEMGAIPKLLARGVALFGSIQAHRIVRHFVTEGHQRVMEGQADARVLDYVGGWSRMAEMADISERDEARAIVLALAHIPFAGPNKEHGNLLSYTWRPHAPGRQARVTITLGDMLLPHYVHAITGKTRTIMEARQLVPVVDLPGFVGRNNEQGPQATLQMLVMADMRLRAVELATHGGVHISDEQWQKMAKKADVPSILLPRVLDRWTRDGDDAPAFLKRLDDGRWTLAPSFSAALDFMVAAGRTSLQASAAGKAKGKPGRRPRAPKLNTAGSGR